SQFCNRRVVFSSEFWVLSSMVRRSRIEEKRQPREPAAPGKGEPAGGVAESPTLQASRVNVCSMMTSRPHLSKRLFRLFALFAARRSHGPEHLSSALRVPLAVH